MEHQLIGPTCTQAEGFVLGIGAKMFTTVGPAVATLYHETARWEFPTGCAYFSINLSSSDSSSRSMIVCM